MLFIRYFFTNCLQNKVVSADSDHGTRLMHCEVESNSAPGHYSEGFFYLQALREGKAVRLFLKEPVATPI